jgi:SNF2 family DNA or RNA helicase
MIEHIEANPYCALWVDMGLGKTVAALTSIVHILREEWDIGGILVIAPLRVARKTWTDEIEVWDHLREAGLSVAKMIGDKETRLAALEEDADIHVINKDNTVWLVDQFSETTNLKKTKRRMTRPWKWATVVIDEVSAFKSYRSKRWAALYLMRPYIDRLIELTGTPSPNSIEDLWSQIALLDMGQRLGKNITTFRDRYMRLKRGNNYNYEAMPGCEKEVINLVSDICLSLRAEDYLDLPPVVYNRVLVEMDEKEHAVYKEMERHFVIELKDEVIVAVNAGVQAGKLLQLANGAVYKEDKTFEVIHDRKIEALLELIEESHGPVLVCYNYKSDLKRILEALKRAKVKHKVLKDEKTENEWNKGKLKVLLLHPASAGHGCNLHHSGSTMLIWFGLNYSLELHQQANARLIGGHRRGDRTVVIHYILTRKSIDFRVMEILDRKDVSQKTLLKGVSQYIKGILA